MSEDRENQPAGGIKGIWRAFWSPTAKFSLGGLLVVGFVAGVIFWGGFNTVMEATNTEKFCISCHEMRDNVYEEYKRTIHYSNRTGVRAVCSDCHVPREWGPKMIRKIQASNEVYHKILGTVNTPEKFEAQRLTMATRVWTTMYKNDSHECRNCHEFGSMDFTKQQRRAQTRHDRAFQQGRTCIDCHKGIAHKLPEGADAWEDAWREANPLPEVAGD